MNENGLKYVSERSTKNDTNIVLKVCGSSSYEGEALRHAQSQRLPQDKDFVPEACQQNGWALKYASKALKSDKDVVLEACKRNGLALEYASERLRADKDIVLAAASSNPDALKFALDSLNQDRDCLVAAGLWADEDYKQQQNQQDPASSGPTDQKEEATKIVLSTRFALTPHSNSKATKFAVLLKQHEYALQQNFQVYSPNAVETSACDPEWTRLDWPCRGTFDTCRKEPNLKVGVPDKNHQSCWRYSFRYQLEKAKESNGFMIQIVEDVQQQQENRQQTNQMLGDDAQRIESEMAAQTGIKVFRVHAPIQKDNYNIEREADFGPKDIDKLVFEIQKWHKGGRKDMSECELRFSRQQNQDQSQSEDSDSRVLTVFQSAPLAYENRAGKVVLLPGLDLGAEWTTLKESLEDTGISVQFEIATSNNLGRFLSRGNQMMHFSGHGHPQFLFIENDHGGGRVLLVNENLKAWIQAGGNNLRFVFVAACHSRSAGEVFVEAGAQHVVCSETDEHQLSNTASIIFARDFYRALSNGRTVQQAYDLAMNAAIHAPELARIGLDPQIEAKKFVLLPEGANHDISLFQGSTAISPPSSLNAASECGLRAFRLPFPPENFIGREREMYTMFRSMILQKTRLVLVTGQKGIGKASFAKAAAQYMERRKMWGDVVWVPVPRRVGEYDVQGLVSKVLLIAGKYSDSAAFLADEEYQEASSKIIDILRERKAVLIIDALRLSALGIKLLSLFFYDLFDKTKQVKVVVLLQDGVVLDPDRTAGFPVSDTKITLPPLDFWCTVFLFGKFCPHADHEFGENIAMKYKEYPESIFKILGAGIPAKTVILARKMGHPEYRKLVEKGVPIVEADFEETLSTTAIYDTVQNPSTEGAICPTTDTRPKSKSFAARAHEATGEESQSLRPIRNQKEVQMRFVPLLQQQGKIYKKTITSFIRKARKGEEIFTLIEGTCESQITVNDDSSYVVCGKAFGEYYVLTQEEFQENYDESSGKPIPVSALDPHSRRLRQRGFCEYRSKRFVSGRVVDEDDMKYFRHGEDTPDYACFTSPWGENMRVEKGDYLVMQYTPNGKCRDEIYCMKRIIFEHSYAEYQEKSESNTFWEVAAVGVAGLAAAVALGVSRPR